MDNALKYLHSVAALGMLTAVLTSPNTGPALYTMSRYLEYTLDERCVHCGYKLTHQFVDHNRCKELYQ